MEFDWVMGCGLGWFLGPKFLLCDGLGWISRLVGCVGLKKIDPHAQLCAGQPTRSTISPKKQSNNDVNTRT